jgi:hypothetical protein
MNILKILAHAVVYRIVPGVICVVVARLRSARNEILHARITSSSDSIKPHLAKELLQRTHRTGDKKDKLTR